MAAWERLSGRVASKTEVGSEPRHAGRLWDLAFPWELLTGTRHCTHLDFNPVRFISDFWSQENCERINLSWRAVTCYSSGRKQTHFSVNPFVHLEFIVRSYRSHLHLIFVGDKAHTAYFEVACLLLFTSYSPLIPGFSEVFLCLSLAHCPPQ